jgi:uncharacterized membrane protein
VSEQLRGAGGELRRRLDRGPHRHPVNQEFHDRATFGERLADHIASGIGSWRFLIIQTALVAVWFALNIVGFAHHWDPFPFILLNLLFSIQAAYTGPVLLLAGNRGAQRDRLMAEHDYATNARAGDTVEQILAELLRNSQATLAIAKRIGCELDAVAVGPGPAAAVKGGVQAADVTRG